METLIQRLLPLLLLGIFSAFLTTQAKAEYRKADYIERIQTVIKKNASELSRTQDDVKTALESKDFVADSTSNIFNNQVARVERLLTEQRECKLRQDFYDRLLFQISTNYQTGSFKKFLTDTLKKMTVTEALNTDGETSMWKFMNYLSYAFQTIVTDKDDPLTFIENYLGKSPISNPISPSAYAGERDYSNGVVNKRARTVSKEDVGELVEAQLGPFAE